MARDRSRRTVVALGILAALAAAVPSAASARVPKDAPVVVGPTASGARLVAYDRGRSLCMALIAPRESRRWAYPDCGRPSLQLRQVELAGTGYPHRSWHHGLVRPEVSEVELVHRDGRTARAPASEGPAYTGRYAGRVRFVLVETRNRRRFDGLDEGYLRLFDASGALLAIGNPFAFRPVRSRPARELRRGTTRGVPWSLRAFRERSLRPLPGNEERFVDDLCVEVWQRGDARSERTLAKACMDPDRMRERSSYTFQQHCRRIGLAAVGVVEPRVRQVAAVLGNGRVRRLALSRLPASHGDGRAFALVVGRDVAVRRLVAVREGGRRELLDRHRAPGAIRCGDNGLVLFGWGHEPVEPNGPVALSVYDEGPLICATLGRPTRHPGECVHPPLDAYDSWILTRRSGGRGLIAGVLPGDITRAVVRLEDGRRVPVETTDGAYGGQYAGRLRFFTLELERGARVALIRLFDAGQRVVTLPSDHLFRAVGPTRVVVGGPPGLRLRARRHSGGLFGSAFLCVALGSGPCSASFNVSVRADCNPRRLVFWGLLPRGISAVTVETDRGDVAARVAPLPRGLLPRPPRNRPALSRYAPRSAFVAAVPARARPTALVISGRREERRRIALPPAAAQCGYEDALL